MAISNDIFRITSDYGFIHCANPDPEFVNWFSDLRFSRNKSRAENYFIIMNSYAMFAYGEKYNYCVGFDAIMDKMVVHCKPVINPKYFINMANYQWFNNPNYDPLCDELGKRL
jgi:hypothetical protein